MVFIRVLDTRKDRNTYINSLDITKIWIDIPEDNWVSVYATTKEDESYFIITKRNIEEVEKWLKRRKIIVEDYA